MKFVTFICCLCWLIVNANAQSTFPGTYTAFQKQLGSLTDSARIEQLSDFLQAMVEQGKFTEATAAGQAMTAIAERTQNKRFSAITHTALGYMEKNQGNAVQAVRHFQQSAMIYQATNSWHRQVTSLERIGGMYIDVKNLPLAESYYTKALAIARSHDLKGDLANLYADLATVYDIRKQYNKALGYNSEGIKLAQSVGKDYSSFLLNRAIILKNDGQYAQSVKTYQQVLKWAEQHQDGFLRDYVYHNLPVTLLLLNRPEEAEHYIRLAEQSVRQRPNQLYFLQNIYDVLTSVYEKKGQYQQALAYHKQWVVYRDSLFNAEKSRQLIDAETQFQTREKQQQIQRLDEDNLRQKQQLRWLIIGVSLLTVLLGIMVWQYQAIRKANRLVNQTLEELKRTQGQLIQKEKMASLGELTAGIAHEIQNPLNFVNNFSELSVDLAQELQVELDKLTMPLGEKSYLDTIMKDLSHNQTKINQHGQRAAGIVRGMLEHVRPSTDDRQLTNLNALTDEYVKIAYHGLRAKDKSFTCALATSFDADLGPVSVVPPEIGRVLLNLFNNAFYAVRQRQRRGEPDYQPTVSVSTKRLANQVEIRVKDNGTGIPEAIKDKIFQPFFTTKPTGEGTGLGLLLSYDIVTKGHGGTLTVESREGEGATFVIRLPAKELISGSTKLVW